MQHEHAVEMLAHASIGDEINQRWADLGCGTGTFTRALASILPRDSTIYAIDMDKIALREMPGHYARTKIITVHGDFATDPLPAPLHGVLLSNALHFVKDQAAFIEKAAAVLVPSGSFILVEYDTDVASPWGPYPLSYAKVKSLFGNAGFTSIIRLGERQSIYGKAMIYSVQIGK